MDIKTFIISQEFTVGVLVFHPCTQCRGFLIESGLTVDSVVYFSPNLSAVFHPQELIENQQSFWQFPGRLSPCYCMVASINDVEHIWTSDPCLNQPD